MDGLLAGGMAGMLTAVYLTVAGLTRGDGIGATLADFAATCRDETDFDKLTARLVEVVDETMQPESVTLWLKDFNAKPALCVAEGTQRREERKE